MEHTHIQLGIQKLHSKYGVCGETILKCPPYHKDRAVTDSLDMTVTMDMTGDLSRIRNLSLCVSHVIIYIDSAQLVN